MLSLIHISRSFTGPDLIAIARKAGIFRRHDLCIHRLSYPVFRNHLLPFPFSAVQIELAELCLLYTSRCVEETGDALYMEISKASTYLLSPVSRVSW